MLEISLLEIGRGIARMFLNPLFYWIIFLFLIVSYRRIKKERLQFGRKIFPFLTEGQYTIGISLAGSLVISLLAVSVGIVMTVEIAIIMLAVIVVLSMTASGSFLSASYTIGLTFIIALILPVMNVFPGQTNDMQPAHYFGLALLAALFLILEALLLLSGKKQSYPELVKSNRGVWVGEQHLRRLAFIPFFCLFPASGFILELPLLPYIDIAGEPYMLVLFPFVIGYDYKVLAELPQKAAGSIGQAVLLLGILTLLLAVISVFIPLFSIAAIVVAILGKEWIMYNHRKKNIYTPNIFRPLDRGVKVLAAIPGSPAARLDISAGETIIKVNGQSIEDSEHFYEALQNSGAFFKLEVLDEAGEIRFINSALYEEDHHELGVIFVEEPFRNKLAIRKENPL